MIDRQIDDTQIYGMNVMGGTALERGKKRVVWQVNIIKVYYMNL
jgi:hypothetical protein